MISNSKNKVFYGDNASKYLRKYNKVLIGKGSFSKVYKLESKSILRRDCAAKVISVSRMNKDKIEKERKCLLDLSQNKDFCRHFITLFYNTLYVDNSVIFIMMLCKGGELFYYIYDKYKESNGSCKKIREPEAKVIMWQLFQGVSYIHKNNYIHRDLKPENIFLKEPNNILDIRIGDFGLSLRNEGEPINTSGRTGSLYYISPEAINKYYVPASDLWSLGVIMYIILTGIPPFEHKKTDKLIERDTSENYKNDKYYKCLKPVTRQLIENLLSVEIDRRFTAEQALQHAWFDTLDTKPIIYAKKKYSNYLPF